MIRTLIAEDHGVVREGLAAVLDGAEDIRVIGETGDGAEVVQLAQDRGPDVVVMDVGLPSLNGVEATRRIVRARPDIRIVVLSMYDDSATVDRALRAGARAYVLKGSSAEHLLDAIRTVARGDVYLSPGISEYVLQGYLSGDGGTDVDPLTEREREVLQLLAEGYTSSEIAERLGLASKTVQNHRTNLMDKLDIKTTAGLVRYAIRTNLVS